MKYVKSYILCIKQKKSKKVYNNIMNSVKLLNRMDTIFMNSGKGKTSDSQRLLFSLLGKIDLNTSDKYAALSNRSTYYTWKNIKKSSKTINLRYQLQSGIKNLNYLMDHIMYLIFKIISSISLRNIKQ